MRRTIRGSMTVEMSLLMSILLFLVVSFMKVVFYYHDKNILAGAAYETAVVGATKMRERQGTDPGELHAIFAERAAGKCIVFCAYGADISITRKAVTVEVSASERGMRLSIIKKARVTEPEKKIRDQRRIQKNGTKNYS